MVVILKNKVSKFEVMILIRLFKNFTMKDIFIILLVLALVVFSVFLDLRTPEYMSKITKLVQTKDSTMNEILIAGLHMLVCAVFSLLCTICVGYFTSLLSARFSRMIRHQLFAKVEEFGIWEMKKFSTSSLITRTTNDVTQIEMLLSMGLPLLIKSPVMAVWALMKILGKSGELSIITGIGVVIIGVGLLLLSIFWPIGIIYFYLLYKYLS